MKAFTFFKRIKKPKKISVKIKLPGIDISGDWEVDENQQKAAWELYIELITRISVQTLEPGEGLLREALTSLYNLFDETRKILRKYGPDVGKPVGEGKLSCGNIAVAVLNSGLRPVLAKWHPILLEYEKNKDGSISSTEHEKAWSHNEELRTVLVELQKSMSQYAVYLAKAAGVPDIESDNLSL